MNKQELEIIRSRADKATNINDLGWCIDDEYDDVIRNSWDYELIAQCVKRKEDAEFIANSRIDIPKLLDEVDRLRNVLETIVMAGHYSKEDSNTLLLMIIENARKAINMDYEPE